MKPPTKPSTYLPGPTKADRAIAWLAILLCFAFALAAGLL
jgi:hypothetical protein